MDGDERGLHALQPAPIVVLLLVHALFACMYGFLTPEGSQVLDQALAILMLVESAEKVVDPCWGAGFQYVVERV